MATQFEKYMHEGNRFINRVAEELGDRDNTDRAFRITEAVFHALRDRITASESMHILSQLPMALKGVYVNGWKISAERKKYDTTEEFMDEICRQSALTAARDLGGDAPAKVQAVFRVMKQYVNEEEMLDMEDQLPEDIACLFEEV